jgi:hypothetical protein
VAALKRLMRYLRETSALTLTYNAAANDSTAPTLTAFSDADWANGKSDMRSITGVLVTMAGGPVCWVSKKQQLTAQSTAEAEYIAACKAAQHVYHLRVLCAEMGFAQRESTPLLIDNNAAIRNITEEAASNFRKFIAVRYHYVREQEQQRHIAAQWIETHKQKADILTKCLAAAEFQKKCKLLMDQ